MKNASPLLYVGLGFLLVTRCSLAAQTGQAGANAAATKPEDLCTLEGRASDAITGEPVNKATVTLRRADSGPAGAGGPQQFGTTSDSTGRFAMKDLEPGSYRLQVSRNGYVTADYGARGPSRPGATVTLSRGQQLKDLTVRVTPQGVVTGRVLDQDGDPIPTVMVQVLKLQYSAGKRQLMTIGAGQSNDLGEYRVAGLAPGKYYVDAGVQLTAAILEGMTVDRSAEPKPKEDYVPTYYPGVTDVVGAVAVDVAAGEQLRGIDIALARRHTVRITGRVSAPAPASMLILAPRSLAGALSMKMVRVSPRGEFEITGVSAGSYGLSGSVQQSGRTYSATLPVEVGQEDIEGLVFSIGPGVAVAGRVRVDGPATADLSRVTVRLQPREMNLGTVMASLGSVLAGGEIGADSGKLGDDLSFRLENIAADRYDVIVVGLPQGYYVKSVHSGADDALASGLEVKSAPPEPLDILVSPNAGRISGSVINPSTRQFAAGAIVTLIPRDKERVEQQQYYRQTNTDAKGSFSFLAVTPGDYRLFAWEDVESGAWMDPDFLKPLEDQGEGVSLKENGQETVQLRLIPAGK